MKLFISIKPIIFFKLTGVCLFIFLVLSCSKTSSPAEVKLSSCDSIQKGLLLKQADSIRLSDCIKISSCDSVRLGLLRPTSADTIRLSACIKITGCDSVRLGLLRPTSADTIRLSNCIRITGCDSLRLGLLTPTKNDTIRLLSCIKITGCDSIRLGILKPSSSDTIRLSACIRISGCDSIRLGILEPTKLNSERLGCIVQSIGQYYQGGMITYKLQLGDPGYDVNTAHGIIASLTDINMGATWPEGAPWALTYRAIGANGREIGTGSSNTIKIINDQLETPLTYKMYAASLVRSYNRGGYTDWFLPSIEELNKLYINKIMTSGLYWSSTERDGSNAWLQAWYIDFSNGQKNYTNKTAGRFLIRAIRYF